MENIDSSNRPNTSEKPYSTPRKTSSSNVQTPRSRAKTTGVAESPGINAREAARLARISHTAEKRRRVSEQKERWAREKQEKLESFERKRHEDLNRLNKTSEVLSEKRRKNSIKLKEIEKQKLLEKKKSLQMSLEEQAQLKADLERQERERRRQSVALNKQIYTKAKQKEEELLRMKKEEEHSLLEAHRLDALAIRESELQEEENRRLSLVRRHEEHKKQKEAEEELRRQKKQEEDDALAMRRDMSKARKEFSEEQRMRHRESLAGRLDEWRDARKREQEEIAKVKQEQTAEFDEKRQVWMDFNEIKRECADRDRQSILWRLDKWRDERDQEEEEKQREKEIQNTERELLMQEWEDVLMFREEQECLRRQSLAYRLDQGARDRDFQQGLEANSAAVKEMEVMIKTAERDDVMDYQRRLEENRRQSLAFRLQERTRIRELEEGTRQQQLEQEQEELQLKAEEWRDREALKIEARVKERRDIAKRIEESQRQKELDLVRHREQLDQMHADFESRREDWKAVQEAKKKDKERSRKSICMRLQSWRAGKLQADRERTQRRMVEEQEAMYRRQDAEDQRAAKAERLLAEKEKFVEESYDPMMTF